MFRCKVCGWLHAGDTPPDICPSCGSPADRFRPVATGLDAAGAGPTGLIPGARIRLLALVPATIDSPFARHDGPRLDVVTGDSAWFDDNIPCMRACPVNTDVATYIGHVAGGAFGLAAQLNQEQNVFAGTLGRTCSRPCEDACRRTVIDSPIQIRALKRVATDHALHDQQSVPIPEATTGKLVAVVGAGVAGLTVARQLRLEGHAVTVFERDQVPGGLMVSGVPAWRLPRDVAETDIETIAALGVTIETGRELGRDLATVELSAKHDAVVIATGAQAAAWLPGTDAIRTDLSDPASGLIDGLSFLSRIASRGQRLDGPVVVIGGGYTAFDCARTARRLAPGVVTIAMRQGPATAVAADELEAAVSEGITVLAGSALIDIVRDGRQVIGAMLRDEAGVARTVPCSLIIAAIGQEPDWSVIGTQGDGESVERDRSSISLDAIGRIANWSNVWMAGDVVDGSTSFIDAIASGKRTAGEVIRWLSGPAGADALPTAASPESVMLSLDRPSSQAERRAGSGLPVWTEDLLHRRVIDQELYREISPKPTEMLSIAGRALETGDPAIEVDGGMTAEIGGKEAARCLQCQVNIFINGDRCILCNGCVDVCPYGCIEMLGLDQLATVDGSSLDLFPGLNRQTVAMLIDEDSCIRCGKCVDWCPTSCLTMSAHPPTLGGVPDAFDIRSLLSNG